jgi:hypothetical protein
MTLRRRVRTLLDRQGRRRSGVLEADRPAVAPVTPESTLEAMFAYQHELSTTAVPRQRRNAGRR